MPLFVRSWRLVYLIGKLDHRADQYNVTKSDLRTTPKELPLDRLNDCIPLILICLARFLRLKILLLQIHNFLLDSSRRQSLLLLLTLQLLDPVDVDAKAV